MKNSPAFIKWNLHAQAPHCGYSLAPHRDNHPIVDPASGFISAGADKDLETGVKRCIFCNTKLLYDSFHVCSEVQVLQRLMMHIQVKICLICQSKHQAVCKGFQPSDFEYRVHVGFISTSESGI